MAAWAAEALARAQVGQRAWAAAPFGERAEALRGFAAALGRRADALAAGLAAESGKVLGQAKAEVRATRARVKAQLQTAERVLSRAPVEHRQGSVLERVVQEPLGVVAAISSWNYPFFVGANVFASALAAGNAVLYKPSELVPETGAAITELLHEAGVPDDVFVNVGADREAGAALAALPGLGGIFFTGSVATGVAILRAAAPHATRVNLELGGKDPAYVRADADVAAAARALCSGVMYNSGQSCCSVERIYVHEAVYADFLEKFCAEARQVDVGPLARPEAVATLQEQLDEAVAGGATVLVGAKDFPRLPSEGNFFPPTVLANVSHTMSLMREESFGPIVDDEAMALMQDTDYGLTAGVYTKDAAAAERLLLRLDVGTGYVNLCDRTSPLTPWSGRRRSGLGATLGEEGFRSFLQPKALHFGAT